MSNTVGSSERLRTRTEQVDKVERQRRVDEAIHSGEMEGFSVSDETRADAADYVAGRIDSHQLVERTHARYGLS